MASHRGRRGTRHQLFSATHSIEARGKLEQRGHQGQQEEGGREGGRESTTKVVLPSVSAAAAAVFLPRKAMDDRRGQRRQKAGRPKETLSQISLADQSQNAIWPVPLVGPPRKEGEGAFTVPSRRGELGRRSDNCIVSLILKGWEIGQKAARGQPARQREARPSKGKMGDIIAVPRRSLATRDRAYGEGEHVHMMMS